MGPSRHLSEGTGIGRQDQGKVVSISDCGAAVTDIDVARLEGVPTDEQVSIHCEGHVTSCIFPADHDQPDMTFLAIRGKSGYLELTLVGDSVATFLGIGPGSRSHGEVVTAPLAARQLASGLNRCDGSPSACCAWCSPCRSCSPRRRQLNSAEPTACWSQSNSTNPEEPKSRAALVDNSTRHREPVERDPMTSMKKSQGGIKSGGGLNGPPDCFFLRLPGTGSTAIGSSRPRGQDF